MFGAKRNKQINKSGTVMVLYLETLDRNVKKVQDNSGLYMQILHFFI